jgi:hypothetical protein
VGSSIDGVIVSVLTLSVVDRGFEHRWCNSKSADFLLLHHRCSNPRSTTLKVSTLTITPPMLVGGAIVRVLTLSVVDRGFEHRWCNSKRAHFECSRSWVRASVV